ncbi:hypothetical protein KOI35_15820 [Actinoplanes bogorensis]|uniref:Uncharacterized protein n=1 Tax=Paractinoplanes bogorensis TaxID=1610840 RepID=A0ABS5YPI0_9ACTN|nr:hypothetical protein [Actinoplanes bogorensis]MBU2664971.1 hypothetical protein [Actinoplanes bogorensis]
MMLAAGCTRTPAASVPTAAAPVASPVGTAVLERWEQWTLSGVSPGEAGDYPELPHRDDCAADEGTDYWFVATPNTGWAGERDKWTCAVPAGKRLLLVPASASVSLELGCDVVLDNVGAAATATLDGAAVALSWAGPFAEFEGSAVCAQWGVTAPLTPGAHTVELAGDVGGQQTKATVAVTVS